MSSAITCLVCFVAIQTKQHLWNHFQSGGTPINWWLVRSCAWRRQLIDAFEDSKVMCGTLVAMRLIRQRLWSYFGFTCATFFVVVRSSSSRCCSRLVGAKGNKLMGAFKQASNATNMITIHHHSTLPHTCGHCCCCCCCYFQLHTTTVIVKTHTYTDTYGHRLWQWWCTIAALVCSDEWDVRKRVIKQKWERERE